ncbi:MAG: GNAT family N-acetyltransferase [Patescibacteria group bacterium]|nr:GNAT family N-acetyltransferase [Patescibacteria group bacterium]
MIAFKQETYDEIIGDGLPLLKAHAAEVAHYPDLMTLDIDDVLYRAMEAKGRLFIASARDDRKLVGYISIFVAHHPHYRGVLHAAEDVHFVHPDHRDPHTAIGLLRFAEKAMRDRGVHVITLRTKVKHDHGRIFERMGFEAMDTVWIKRLDGG